MRVAVALGIQPLRNVIVVVVIIIIIIIIIVISGSSRVGQEQRVEVDVRRRVRAAGGSL